LNSTFRDNYNTDDDYGDDLYVGDGLYLVNAFQDSRFDDPPIAPDPTNPDEAAAGTVYLFKDTPIQNKTAIDESGLLGFAQGSCTRTQNFLQVPENDMNGKSYCQFTYEFIDNSGTRYASFTAEGAGQGNFASLTVTGGLGELDGVSGIVELYVAMLDFSSSPPLLIRDESANDFLAFVDGYDMYAYLHIPSQGAH
jgi:hypothetical protein